LKPPLAPPPTPFTHRPLSPRTRARTVDSVSATWRLVWTTEKETLWIIQNAGLFGTKAGEVYQVRSCCCVG